MNGSSNGLNTSGVEEVIAALTLDVEPPSDIPADAEVVPIDNEGSQDTNRHCPPYIALQAVENALTPRKKSSFLLKEAKGIVEDKDLVYKTWHYLRDQVKGNDDSNIPLPSKEVENHPLVISGLIPRRLVDVFPIPQNNKKEQTRRRSIKARVLTSAELSEEIREKHLKNVREKK